MAKFITGKIQIDGVETEFVFDAGNGSWQQWGGTREELGARVEYLEAMESGLKEHTDYFSQSDDEDDEDEFEEGSRVLHTDPDNWEQRRATVLEKTGEDTYLLLKWDGTEGEAKASEMKAAPDDE